jgi:hypothetical protein
MQMNATAKIIDAEIDATPKGTSLAAMTESVGAITPMVMLDRAVASGASIETLEKLMGLQERWEKNQARKAFDDAMAAAKAEIPVIFKSRTVDFTSAKGRTHYRYEDLAEIARTVNPVLGKFGLSYRFRTSSASNEPVSVTCIVSHRLGYFEENTLVGPRDDSGNKNSLQQVGSTLTYLQRMTLKAALGLAASDDDDARAAGNADAGAISEAQAETIRKLIEDTGSDAERFCKHFKIEAVPDLPVNRFDDAVSSLKRKAAKS